LHEARVLTEAWRKDYNQYGRTTRLKISRQPNLQPSINLHPGSRSAQLWSLRIKAVEGEFISKVMDKCAHKRGGQLAELGAGISR
jgi:hypothetical protein